MQISRCVKRKRLMRRRGAVVATPRHHQAERGLVMQCGHGPIDFGAKAVNQGGCLLPHELIGDNFTGGGGTSLGLEMALGRSPDIAINHDAEAIAMNAANPPDTRHCCGHVRDLNPTEACGGRPAGLVGSARTANTSARPRAGSPSARRFGGSPGSSSAGPGSYVPASSSWRTSRSSKPGDR